MDRIIAKLFFIVAYMHDISSVNVNGDIGMPWHACGSFILNTRCLKIRPLQCCDFIAGCTMFIFAAKLIRHVEWQHRQYPGMHDTVFHPWFSVCALLKRTPEQKISTTNSNYNPSAADLWRVEILCMHFVGSLMSLSLTRWFFVRKFAHAVAPTGWYIIIINSTL